MITRAVDLSPYQAKSRLHELRLDKSASLSWPMATGRIPLPSRAAGQMVVRLTTTARRFAKSRR